MVETRRPSVRQTGTAEEALRDTNYQALIRQLCYHSQGDFTVIHALTCDPNGTQGGTTTHYDHQSMM